MASSANSAGPQGDDSAAGAQANTDRNGALAPLFAVVPEPSRTPPTGTTPDIAIVFRPSDAHAAARDVTVYLVQSGAIIAKAGLDSDGVFRMKVRPGVYSVVAVGSGGFAAFSMHVPAPAFSQAVATQRAQASSKVIDLVAVPRAHFGVLERLLAEQARVRPGLALSTSEPPKAMGQFDRSRLASTAIHEPMHSHTVRLSADGRLIGRMRRLHLQTGHPLSVSPLSVFFIRDGVSTSGTTADENGAFEMSGLEPGDYSVVAIGPDGFAAFDILVAPPQG
ncbi:MAG: hypothetical protein HQ582_05575, partial [Planctomycetes bacterium]|nr:hypothetical protein [Planctomycetota bacterium]